MARSSSQESQLTGTANLSTLISSLTDARSSLAKALSSHPLPAVSDTNEKHTVYMAMATSRFCAAMKAASVPLMETVSLVSGICATT